MREGSARKCECLQKKYKLSAKDNADANISSYQLHDANFVQSKEESFKLAGRERHIHNSFDDKLPLNCYILLFLLALHYLCHAQNAGTPEC
jgi:hypothetical protein